MYSSVYGCRPTYPWRPSHALRTSQRYDNFAITQTAVRFLHPKTLRKDSYKKRNGREKEQPYYGKSRISRRDIIYHS